MHTATRRFLFACAFLTPSLPAAAGETVFKEVDGLAAVEAEHFFRQAHTDRRAFRLTTAARRPTETPDGDPPHVAGAGNGAYLEALPDTRRTHADRLIRGENFSPRPGQLAVLHYKVHVTNPGRYYIWVRAYSTGSEDNGLHVGLDGDWPASGRRLQWCKGKHTWRWESRQRTQKNHCGEPHKIYLDIDKPGVHTVSFSMREDGFEFDRWLMTTDRNYPRPEGVGPEPRRHAGPEPQTYQYIDSKKNRLPDGDGTVKVTGELKRWHKVTLTLDGPFAAETDASPNPFTDYAFSAKFRHADGATYTVPGYFAADGDAANTSAAAGVKWRAHFAPDRVGEWTYKLSFRRGKRAAVGGEGEPLAPFDGKAGSFAVTKSDKGGRDLRAHGRLQYVGKRYLRFAGSGRYFLKAGADAPETLLGYKDFDGTVAGKPKKVPLKTWKPHVQDWKPGDPTWKKGKGKGLIGAINYLSGKGCNAFSFLTYNAGGDGDNVWPFVKRNDKLHYDCSKLDQWGVVFDHGTARGMYLHFKMQETEMDDNRRGKKGKGRVKESLDGGDLGVERKLYCRELIARFGHNLALNWNLGEENTQSTAQQKAMIDYIAATDAYGHNIVVHTFPNRQDKVYRPLIGGKSKLTGLSLQNGAIKNTHWQTVKWVEESTKAGKPWVVAFDESGTAAHGQCPDLGYKGFDGRDTSGKMIYTEHQVRRLTLWGHLAGGGAGVEYYFGYKFVENDLKCEDWRSRDRSWDYCRIAIQFFHDHKVPFHRMKPADGLIGNPKHDNSKYCLAAPGEVYVVYLPDGKTTGLDLKGVPGKFTVRWFNPRAGGGLQPGTVVAVDGLAPASLGRPAMDDGKDWVALVRRAAPAKQARPNIVVFLSDDHTWRDSSVYGDGTIATPNMARLAKAGMTFTQAFVASPSCAPSRAALLTGLYPARNGAEANHSRPRADIKKLPAYLQDLGYEVVSFGKVGHYRQTPEYGFDLARHFNYHEDVAVPKALEWLKARDSDKPLCLFVGTNWPHVPWPEKTAGIDPERLRVPPNHVDCPLTREWRAKYAAAVRTMDNELGQVYDLARGKLGDDTFFLHTSDHGAQWPFGKWTLYEDGVRTPLIVSWPGRVKAGTRTAAMVSWIDILPTLVEAAGGERPQGIDGRSFMPVLRGRADTHRDFVYLTHSGDGDYNVYPSRAVRSAGGLKYIRNLNPEFRFTSHVTKPPPRRALQYWKGWIDAAKQSPEAKRLITRYGLRAVEELYDVTADPYEQTNLDGDSRWQRRQESMSRRLDAWMKAAGDTQAVHGRPTRLPQPAAPNVIVVFIDDMGWSDLSCYGGKAVKTENIDRLAAEGLRFTQFYINSPICSPSRVALTTGQYPQRWRITSYLASRKKNRQRGMAQWLNPKAPVLARELRHAGYATGHFGKWHMGGQRDVGDAPLIGKYGFDRSLTNFEGLGPRVLPLKDAYNGKPPARHGLGSPRLGKGPIRWLDRSVITAAFVKDAVEFIDDAAALNKPFYINLWPDDVHSPFFPPRDKRSRTDGSKRALYRAVLDAMDEQLGLLFDRVRRDPELRNNTLILVMSDNGPERGAGNSAPLRGTKGALYEGGVRSPLIVWWPGRLKAEPGTVNKTAILSAIDVNRSLYTLTGTPVPKGVRFDGVDVSATLTGGEERGRAKPIFWRRPPDRPGAKDSPWPDLAVRDGKWKLYADYAGRVVGLYDLSSDAAEAKNVAGGHPKVAERLRNAVVAWNAGLPTDGGAAAGR